VKNLPFRQRLSFALAGVAEVWRREKSFRTQALLAIAAVAVVILIRPGLLWIGLVVAAIALVLALEMVNAAIESMIDHLHPEVAPEIRRAKDVAAAAVLVASAGAAVVGLLMILAWLRS
jgi:undecaprenol kinase